MSFERLHTEATELLKSLIATQSFSKEESGTAALIENFLQKNQVVPKRHLNNVWAVNKYFEEDKPSVLLNSHHDTVKPNPQYTKNPFEPVVEEGRLYGLGSNDAGGCLVSLIATFLHFYERTDLKYNIVLGASSEEEISGFDGIEALLRNAEFCKYFKGIGADFGIVGEPTQMNLAIAEKGLMVLDCISHGKAGHAAREEGENAIYKAIRDITWINTYQFPKISEWLGKVKMSVTVISTDNRQHNVVPATCNFVVDVRVTDAYSHEVVLETIQENIESEVKPRSLRMRSTRIDVSHPIIQAGISLGKTLYGSPTCSDKALMPFQALKCGPGDSARSHTADEYIYLEEINNGIDTYIAMLEKVV